MSYEECPRAGEQAIGCHAPYRRWACPGDPREPYEKRRVAGAEQIRIVNDEESTLDKALGTVVVPVNKIGIDAGEEVEVRLF